MGYGLKAYGLCSALSWPDNGLGEGGVHAG